MRLSTLSMVAALVVAFATSTAPAQTIVAKALVGDGKLHQLQQRQPAAQKRLYVDSLGGTLAKFGANGQEIIKFPNVLLFFRPMQAPTGGTIGTTVNHIGFSVPNLRPVVAKLKANGFKMITTDSVAATVKVTDDIAAASPTTNIAFALGPEDTKVELVEVTTQTAPIQLHHVHLFGQQNAEMQAWYVKTFGAKARSTPGAAFVSADLPGVALNFTPSPAATVGTTGRALDHIGFEVKGLEAFLKKLEADGIKLDRPYTKVAALNIAIAFIQGSLGHEYRADRRTRRHRLGRNRRPRRQRSAWQSKRGSSAPSASQWPSTTAGPVRVAGSVTVTRKSSRVWSADSEYRSTMLTSSLCGVPMLSKYGQLTRVVVTTSTSFSQRPAE